MNKIGLLLVFFMTSLFAQAQTPQKFNYQAVVRNNNGTIVAGQNVSIRFSLRDGSASGTVQYRETHQTTTNNFGLINLQVGAGNVVNGSFAGVTWNTGSKFLQVEADITGGTSYTNLATVELVAVPYALQSGEAGSFSGSLAGEVTGTQNATVIAVNAVSTPKIADNAVMTSKIADNAVTTPKVADFAITNTKLADDAVTTAKMVDNAVVTSKLADNAVTTPKIADLAIINSKLADNAVGTTKITDNAVTTPKVADFTITNTKLADDAVTTAKMVDNAVVTSKIANNAVTASKIAAGEVVKSLNGIKDDITIAGTGGTTVNVTGNTITIGGAAGTISNITAGAGLTGGGSSGNVNLAAAFGGNGVANTISRSDHDHIGQTWSTNSGYVLRMYDNDITSTPFSINSYATGFSNAGISSQIFSATGQSVAVFGNTVSTDAFAAGVFGQAYGNGAAKGVWGLAHGSNTFGVFGQAAGAGSWAGYFEGRVHVNGTLSKAAGSFKIDHPLDPSNKFLSHSFVESPDMMNVYNGNAELDANGEATVTMPDWFEALNKDFRYQLTAMGKPSPGLYIAEEMNGNRFRIAGGAPGGKVSWQVTGIRNDPYARENPIVVEEQKPASERGTYLYPKGYGQSLRTSAPRPRIMEQPEKDNK